mgnify:CR=1 FL=1
MVDTNDFYWQTARDSLLTEAALTMYQVAVQYNGYNFDDVKFEIDEQYDTARGRETSTQRHGGNFQTFIRVFEEAGWMYIDSEGIIRITDAGYQAQVLLTRVPDFLKAVPFYLIELLSRYQLNNPTGPNSIRNEDIQVATQNSNVFPYWTIWRIMRSCDNHLTTDELRRFVFRLHRTENITQTINQIRAYRNDVENGLPEGELNTRYPAPLQGAVGEPKYIMARAGTHIGTRQSLITKPNPSTYELNPVFEDLIDAVLENEPVFQDYLDENTWMRDYGRPVMVEQEFLPFTMVEDVQTLEYEAIPDDDPVWVKVKNLIEDGVRNILFVGPPGTSKTWYALHIGAKLVNYQKMCFRNIQFHQSFGYEDFMEGYVPSERTVGSFVLKAKTFLYICSLAHRNREHLYSLVIDELNRGDPSRIFGEALTYIERRDESFTLSSGTPAVVPSNLVILSTINPFDKSIADIDMAMERRFAKIEMPPDRELLRKILTENGWSDQNTGRIIGFFDQLGRIFENRIGHAYFKNAKTPASLERVWQYEILPVLNKEFRFRQDEINGVVNNFDRLMAEIRT